MFIHLHSGKKWRGRSPKNVISEIELLVNDYGVKHIAFLDDNMGLSKTRMHEICNIIIENKLYFEWSTPNGLRADTLDENLLIKMKKSGCVRIGVSPESGSQRVVNEVIGKKLDLQRVVDVVKICKKIGIKVDCFFIMGLEGETKKDIEKTIGFARRLKKLGASGLNMAVATPFRGTKLYEQFMKKGYLPEGFDAFSIFRQDYYVGTTEFTSNELAEFKNRADRVNEFPFDYIKFMTLVLFRDPLRFFRLAYSTALSKFKFWGDD
ncbi:MAG: radical SAM protein [Candidatus Bathyarchaeota archaeon]|nr:radical SAM protein [Candidatus Bathyarchaeota archaeon]